MRLKTLLYRGAFALRHPEAVSIWRRGIDYDQYRRLNKPWLQRLQIRTVIDVGANVGQFARLAHAVLPEATIYSFEPLPDCHRELQSALGEFRHFRALNYALGDSEGDLDFWRSPHSPSSSLLRMTPAHEAVYPESRHSTLVRVRVRPLDDACRELPIQDNILVKIDVQGYEGPVLRGGGSILRRAAAALVETSFLPLYRDQDLFSDIQLTMSRLGFGFFGNLAQQEDPQTGCPLYADSIFINNAYVDRIRG
jgi:FkbM family methyltransferase